MQYYIVLCILFSIYVVCINIAMTFFNCNNTYKDLLTSKMLFVFKIWKLFKVLSILYTL